MVSAFPFSSGQLLSFIKKALIAALMAACVFLMDTLYIHLFRPDMLERFTGWQMVDAFYFLFALFLAALYSHPRIAVALVTILAIAQISEFGYFSYFGLFFGPYDIWALFSELEDTFKVVVAEPMRILPSVVVSSLLWIGVIWTLARFGSQQSQWPVTVIFSLLFFVPAIQFYGTDKDYFRPSYHYHSSHNALFSVNYFLASVLPGELSKKEGAHYAPYQLRPNTLPQAKTVILIVGESVSPTRLQALGYGVETTPLLQQMKEQGLIDIDNALSSASTTQIASGMIINAIYEPNNLNQFVSKGSNLFRVASQQGYKTHYITTQKTKTMSYYFYDSSIEVYKEYDHMQEKQTHGDRRILETIQDLNINFTQKNFFVLQHRNAHTPYPENYPPEFDKFKPADDSYQETTLAHYHNSLLYFDYTMAELIRFLEEKTDSAALFYVSDHGELVGENGMYGHRSLSPMIAAVPVITYTKNVSEETMASLYYHTECMPTHFNVARSAAQLMGVDIHNPNYQPGVAYMNGLDINGSQGYLTMDVTDFTDKEQCSGNQVAMENP